MRWLARGLWMVAAGAVASGLGLPARGQTPPVEPAMTPMMRETGEPEGDAFHLPPMPVDPRVYQMNDPALSALARKIEDGSANMIQRRAWWWLEQRLAPFDKPVPADWRINAQATIKAMERARSEQEGAAPEAAYTWAPIGPLQYRDYNNLAVSGRATALRADPTNANSILLGTADGGVWKTSDKGTTWVSIFDSAASQSVGSLAVDPNDSQTIYVGTGEGNFNGDMIGGVGVYKSTNGGSTWTLQSLPFYWQAPWNGIRRIAVDKLDSQKVYAAGDGGLYYSTNGGTSWTRVDAEGGMTAVFADDLVLDSVNGTGTNSIVYVAIHDKGIFRSTGGGGGTWTKISGSSPFPTTNLGRITLVQAPSAPTTLYALLQDTSTGGNQAVFSTANANAATPTWTARTTTNFCAGQAWYDMTGAVDPTNPAHLIVGGLDVYQSTSDYAATITKVSCWYCGDSTFSHADHHHMVMPNATTVYDANDGGFFIGTINWSSPSGTTWVTKNPGLNTLQFYGFAQHPTDSTKVQGGLQDNGQFYNNGTSWLEVQGGDGGCSAWDQSDPRYAYEEYVYLNIARNSNMVGSPSSWSCIMNFNGCSTCGGCAPDSRVGFIAPFTLDPNNQNTMYAGTYRVLSNTSVRTGTSWTAISGDLTGGSGNISAIHSAKNNGASGIIYAGTNSGKVQVSTDGGASWTDLSSGLSGATVTSFATDPANGLHVLVTVSGYGTAHVYRSATGATAGTWTDITGGLPAQPFNTIILDPADANHAYAGSDFGVFESTNVWATSPTWSSITSNLPAVSVQQLGYVSGGKLRATTHGRGIWELTVSTGPNPKEDSPSHNMKATKWTGTQVSVAFANGCGATDNTIYTGNLATLQSSGISWTNRYCNKGTTSPVTFDPGSSSVYFVIVANNGGTIEGSYGQNSSGTERAAAGAGSPCSYTQNLTGTCP